ncbi:MAG: hypothetical protein JXQ65_02130 [Candidatus Marinimicrobia bacterium]|nr:hypothetical protein [Candidatus Neomarinimicrobiota bacterium]
MTTKGFSNIVHITGEVQKIIRKSGLDDGIILVSAIRTWQQIVVIDHDNRPGNRKIFIRIAGE